MNAAKKVTFHGSITTKSDFTFSPPGIEFFVNGAIGKVNEIRTATAQGMCPHISGNLIRGALRSNASQVLLNGIPGGTLSLDDVFLTTQGGKPAKQGGGFAKIKGTKNPAVTLFGAINDGPFPTASKVQVGHALFGEAVGDKTARALAVGGEAVSNLKFTSKVRFPLNRRMRPSDPDYRPYVNSGDLAQFDALVEIGLKASARREIESDESLDNAAKKKAKKEQDDTATHNQVIVRSMAIPSGNTGAHRIAVLNPSPVEIGLLLHAMERLSLNPQLGAQASTGMGLVSMDYEVTVVESGQRAGSTEQVTVECDEDGVSQFSITKGGYLEDCYKAFATYHKDVLSGSLEDLKVDLK